MPDELGQYYPSMFQFASLTAIEPATDLLKAAYRITSVGERGEVTHPLAELLIDFLADTGNGPVAGFPGETSENTTGIKLMLPVFGELTDRDVWNDVYLLAALPRLEDRAGVLGALRLLTQAMPGTEQNIYDAYMGAVARATPQDVYNFAHSLSRFVDSDAKLLDPSLTALRQAFYVNDVHPLIDLIKSVLADAPSNDPFFGTLFLISELPEFKDSVKLVSVLAEDGRLKELLSSILTLYHKFANQGATPINPVQEPPFVPSGAA